MKHNLNKHAVLRSALCIVLVLAMLPFSALTALADGEFTRELSVTDITVTVGGKTLDKVYSDPASYYEEASSGYLNSYEIKYQKPAANDTVIYTAL